jgi:hypothetical protein
MDQDRSATTEFAAKKRLSYPLRAVRGLLSIPGGAIVVGQPARIIGQRALVFPGADACA